MTVAKSWMKMAADLVWQGLQPNKKRQFIAAFLPEFNQARG
jgi:hypothetical protein